MKRRRHSGRFNYSKPAVLIVLFLVCSCSFVKVRLTPFGAALEEAQGYRDKDLEKVEKYLCRTELDAFVALEGEKLIMEWGATEELINCASVRKSIISILYGIAEDKGLVDLDATLFELGIDDAKSPLTYMEKKATVRDLLKSRSGIYIRAQGENKKMKDRRPERGEHRPGEHFYYNNWGFNVLGTIFEKETGMLIGEAVYEWLARPTGMKHFNPSHVIYSSVSYTEHRMYRIYMSAEDLARIGVLMAQEGLWKGKPVVPANWVRESIKPWSKINRGHYEGYGYLWWLDLSEGTVWATGSGGQFLLIDPERDLVLSGRNRTGSSPLKVGLYGLFGEDASPESMIKIHHMLISFKMP